MPGIKELLHEHSLHSVRSDGSQMIVLETGQAQTSPEWEVLFIHKDGRIDNDGIITLEAAERAVLRKTYTNEKLQETAALHDFVEWRPSVLEEYPSEDTLKLQDQLHQAQHDLQEKQTQYEAIEKQLQEAQKRIQDLTTLTASQRRKERAVQRTELAEIEQYYRDTVAAIAERSPSETQKIIANQVALGAGFYQEVGIQSRASFRLSLWLAAAGGIIFLLTALAAVFITLFRGDTTLIVIIGSIASALTEGLAASNRLYNQASRQFANFQVYLDRINRSSICYAMISEEDFEKKTQKQQDEVIKIIEALLQ